MAVDAIEFYTRSGKDVFGNALLCYRYVVKLFRRLALRMLADHTFAEMAIVLRGQWHEDCGEVVYGDSGAIWHCG